ncbi:ABC transporter permease [Actinophytocola sp.]|uniref:ABC transporter permease n=1 Tax=Actinophytocola sp. TaxID=1872138 RepID=UPI002ED2BD43
MLKAMLRDLRAHPGRIAMTLVAIMLGVAFVVATWVLSDSTVASVSAGDTRSDVDVVVRGQDRGTVLGDDELARLAELPGVTRATGVLVARAALVGADAKIIHGSPDRAGTGWDGTDRFVLTAGRAPTGPGEIALSHDAATAADLREGAQARVILADGGEARVRVTGLFDYRTLGVESAPSVAFDPTTANGMPGAEFDRIELTGTVDVATVRAAMAGLEVRTGAALAAEARDEATDTAQSTRESLLAFAAVALLVGMFVIANTFTMLVTQRVRQFALLRAVGATRRQVRRAVLLEAGALGVVGGTLGVALGIGFGALGMWAFTPGIETVTVAVSPLAVVIGYAVGIGVTAVAAYGSARRAAAVPPVAALRADVTPPRRTTIVRTTAGGLLLAGGVLTVVLVAGPNLSTTERVVCLGAAVAGWLGVLLLAPVFAHAVLHPVGRLLSRRGGPVTRLATRNAVRDPRRTAATSSALLVGMALVCAFATLGETMVSTMGGAVRDMVPSTATILRSASGTDPLATDVLDRVRATQGVTGVAADRYTLITVSHNGSTTASSISATEPTGFRTVLTPKIVEGSDDLRRGVVVDTNQAAMMGVGLGDEIGLEFPDTPVVRQRIVGLLDTVEGQPLIYVDVARSPEWFRTNVTSVYATGQNPAAVRKALHSTFASRPDVLVSEREAVIAEEVEAFQLILRIMYAMFGAAIVIAIFGVINTLALSVTERTREIGVLRAIGASRALVRRTVRVESIVICAYGGVLGITVGILFGAVMQHTMLGNPLLDIGFPLEVTATALAGMLAVGVLSALWPARRAARTEVLKAIRTE